MAKFTHQVDDPTVAADIANLANYPAEPDSTGTSHQPEKVGTDSDGHGLSTPRDNLATAAAGRKVGKYVILGELGAGGMGVVYQAVNPDLQCVVALKMIRSGAMARPKDIHRFLQESAALARVKHPNIVPVHDADEFEGQPYFVMEYLAGGSLSKHLSRYKEDRRLAVGLIAKLARAVHQLHQHNMVHRDLKPANVLLDDSGEPYISDFGLVKLLDTSDNLTRSKQGIGTPSYMAPEQTGLTKLCPGPQTDIWALGVMLYELLVGQRPFAADDQAELFRQIIHDEPSRPSASKTGFDPGLEAVMFKCLEKVPADRFATALDLADELDRWLRGEPLKTKPPTRWQRALRFASKHPLIVCAGVAILLAGLILPVFFYWSDPQRVLEAYHQKLVRGETVRLVPEKGMPKYARPVLTKTGTLFPGIEPYRDYLTINAWELHLVELLKELPPGGLRLRAKVRHIKTNESYGEVGVYFAYSCPVAEPRIHRFFSLTFNDLILERKSKGLPNAIGFRSRHVLEIDDRAEDEERLFGAGDAAARFQPALRDARWRNLTVNIRPEAIEVDFDGLWKGGVTLPDANREFQKAAGRRQPGGLFHALLAAAPADFNFQGSVGLLVADSNACFSNVLLEPLPD